MIHRLYLSLFLLMSASVIFAQVKPMPQVYPGSSVAQKPAIKPGVLPLSKNNVAFQPNIDYGSYTNGTFFHPSLKLKVTASDDNGIPQWFRAEIEQDAAKGRAANVKTWFDELAELLQLDMDQNAFELYKEETDDLGEAHLRLNQHHNGVRVHDAEVILHEEAGIIYMQNGRTIPSHALPENPTPQISAEDAMDLIKQEVSGIRENWNPYSGLMKNQTLNQWEHELVYYKHDGQYHLAYNVLVYLHLGERKSIMVDANKGFILDSWDTICHMDHNHKHAHTCNHDSAETPVEIETTTAFIPGMKDLKTVLDGPATANAQDLFGVQRTVNTYDVNNVFYMIDASRPMWRPDLSALPDEPIGAIWTIDANNSPVGGDIRFSHVANQDNRSYSREAVSAHYNAGQAYEYFLNTHGRNSMSGDGQTIVSFINIADENGNSFGNAFFNGAGIWYGNGDSNFFPLGRALDVAGHELSHGVVQASAGLIYRDESGAMNEAFADIFGAMIDREDWLIGEDVVRPNAFPSGALRNMEDPHNGAQFGDISGGWQPRHFNERFTGSEDNGGVHINSGIINNAYYRYAVDVGRSQAERVFYRALTVYLTRSSGFEELRFAAEQSAMDLFGADSRNRVGQAFAAVGIGEATNTNFEENFDVNNGGDFLLASSEDLSELFIFDLVTGANVLPGPLSTTPHRSKPSITDDGSRVVFVGMDNHIYLIDLDWSTNPPRVEEQTITSTPDWRNAVISRDGNRIAFLEVVRNQGQDNLILAFDLETQTQSTFTLFNPSFTTGVETGNVAFADAMEFDHTGNVLMYDALNVIPSNLGGSDVEYWDIGFLTIWNPNLNGWPLTDEVNKLFGSLPETISIGNPTYSKNSPFIIAFDLIEELANGNINNAVLGMNIESYDQVVTFENAFLAYPNYSRTDEEMVFDARINSEDGVGRISLADDKITATSSIDLLGGGLRFATWFSTGVRVLSDVDDLEVVEDAIQVFPVPASDELTISLDAETVVFDNQVSLEIIDAYGRIVQRQVVTAHDLSLYKMDVSELSTGTYVLVLRDSQKIATQRIVKL